jgi:hypothetical protein
MISLVLSMIGARRAQALTVLLLSIFTVGAAVAGPGSVRSVDRAIAAHEVSGATAGERTVSLFTLASGNDSDLFDQLGPTVGAMPGFDQVQSVEHSVFPGQLGMSRLVFRADVCAHLTLVSGRCIASPFEVMLDERTAAKAGVHSGQTMIVFEAVFDDRTNNFAPGGTPSAMTVVGTYRVRDLHEPYWGRQTYFSDSAEQTQPPPVFADRLTLEGADHSQSAQARAIDEVAAPGSITVESIPSLRARLDSVRSLLDNGSGSSNIDIITDLPNLLDRIERGRDLADELVPIAFLPLVALCWFVIYLAVAYGVFGRRQEVGLVALRGVGPVRRWWLATGETALVIIVGAPIGYVVGYLAVKVAAHYRLEGVTGPIVTAAALPYALVALLGALVAAQLGQQAELRTPVGDLLRRVSRRGRAWQSLAVEILAVVLAGVAIFELRSGGLSGIALLVPGLVVAAVALIGARLVVPIVGGFARYALRRGRLGSALAAVQLARRPGSQRLFVLLTVALAMLGFVATALNVATLVRHQRALVENGAPTVAVLDRVDARTLIEATHQADPQGAWALAVVTLDPMQEGDLPILAVDSPRLAGTGIWRPEYGADVAAVATALRPKPPKPPVVVTGGSLKLDLDYIPPAADSGFGNGDVAVPDISVVLLPVHGGPSTAVDFGLIKSGRHTYTTSVYGCADGCRMAAIRLGIASGGEAEVVLHGLSQSGPDAVLISADQAQSSSFFRITGTTRLSGGVDGADIDFFNSGREGANALLLNDVPSPLPAAVSGGSQDRNQITGLDQAQLASVREVAPKQLPRVGGFGGMVDLEYAERAAGTYGSLDGAEVWLGPAAPADAVAKLKAAGLPVTAVHDVATAEARLASQGPALALWFHLIAAVFGIVLALGGVGLVAAVDRRRRADDLRSLRWQGLAPRFVRRASLWGNLFVVLAAAACSVVAGAAAWAAVGDRLPMSTDTNITVATPHWPQWRVVAMPMAIALAAIVVVSIVAALDLRRAVARNGRDSTA